MGKKANKRRQIVSWGIMIILVIIVLLVVCEMARQKKLVEEEIGQESLQEYIINVMIES